MKSALTLIVPLVASQFPVSAQQRMDAPMSIGGPSATGNPLGAAITREVVRLAEAGLNGSKDATAQLPDESAWSRIRLLGAGENIRVVLDNATSYQGTCRMVDDASVTLVVRGRDQQVSRARVRQVSVARGTHRRRNVLLGLAIGAATGLVVLGLHCHEEEPACKEAAPAYFYPGAGAGAAVGALLPAGRVWEEIYVRTQP